MNEQSSQSNFPKTAYVLLWFPEPTETFIFHEVLGVQALGLPTHVFTLYGEIKRHLSVSMQSLPDQVERLGPRYALTAFAEVYAWWKRDAARTKHVLRTVPWRRWKGWEKCGENLWAFFCGFKLARRFVEESIEHIHAPWAGGPATAAWVASNLTGIPFSFTARAWDIWPPDGGLVDKIRDAAFVRCNTRSNLYYLHQLAGLPLTSDDSSKIRLIYNGISLATPSLAAALMRPPYRFLALGRFIGKKGYEYLLQACRLLKDQGLDFRLTLAGDGPRALKLKSLAEALELDGLVDFPGFIPHERVSELFQTSDIFFMPSVVDITGDRDGIPNVILEALVHRVPVIATDVSGIGEVVENRVTGLLTPQRDPEAIARAVHEMLANREHAMTMAAEGREKVLRQFDPPTNYSRIRDTIAATSFRTGRSARGS